MTDTLLSKCAEQGVNPHTLVKKADRLVREHLKAIPGELAANALVPGIGGVAQPIATTMGYFSYDTPEDYISENENQNFIPFARHYNTGRRLRMLNEASGKRRGRAAGRNTLAELLGAGTAALAAGTIGGAIGRGMVGAGAPDVRRHNATMIGASLGLTATGAATTVGALVAAIRRRRTLGDQAQYDASPRMARNLLVPGVASYNVFKRLGASRNLIDDEDTRRRKAKKDDKKRAKQEKKAAALDAIRTAVARISAR